MLTKSKVKSILKEYDELYEKISEIIDLHRKKDDLYYEITDIELQDEILMVSVEYYKWQDINHHYISIELEMLSDESVFREFADTVDKKVKKRKQKEEDDIKAKNEKAIQDALDVLKKNGVKVN